VTCHELDGEFVPLGPTAANLNRDIDGGPGNQLAHWQDTGLLSDAPDLEQIPVMSVYDDPSTGTVAERARAWLHVNCAHCHNPRGSARSIGPGLASGNPRWQQAAVPGEASLTLFRENRMSRS